MSVEVGSLVVFMLKISTFSQGSAGRLVGAIIDSNGGVIDGATVTFLDWQSGTNLILISDESVSFFSSSRRRHTRSLRDWSSDVCSSDLHLIAGPIVRYRMLQPQLLGLDRFD